MRTFIKIFSALFLIALALWIVFRPEPGTSQETHSTAAPLQVPPSTAEDNASSTIPQPPQAIATPAQATQAHPQPQQAASLTLVPPELETGSGQPLLASRGGSLAHRIPPLPRGEASLQLDGRSILPLNHSGHYQRVLIGSETTAQIDLHWPGAGQRTVLVNPIQGGRINGHHGPRTLQTDPDGRLAFNFSTTENPGRYEVLLSSGPTEEVLHFWVPTGHPALDPHGL